MKHSTTESRLDDAGSREAEIAIADTVGRLMHFWGFKRPMGRLWTMLYLSPHPLTAADLGQALKMSAGAVSMALNELEQWKAVTRTWVPGDRRDYFVAEADIWQLVKRVVRNRELGLVRDFRSKLETATSELSEFEETSVGDPSFELSYKRDRLEHLQKLSEAGELLLVALVEGDAIDPTAVFTPPGSPSK